MVNPAGMEGLVLRPEKILSPLPEPEVDSFFLRDVSMAGIFDCWFWSIAGLRWLNSIQLIEVRGAFVRCFGYERAWLFCTQLDTTVLDQSEIGSTLKYSSSYVGYGLAAAV
jgi:hypothetical protein